MKVENLIFKMLTENTGTHMLDSGGANGRHWQDNKKKTLQDFKKEEAVSYDLDYGSYTISIFHYLTRQLELNEVCNTFNHLNNNAPDWDYKNAYGVSKKAGKYLDLLASKIGEAFNTYNGESSLSQVIQGSYVTINKQSYVLLQIHGGCDVRGGYTNARLFKIASGEEWLSPEDVYGKLNEKNISNTYNGYSLTYEDTNEEIKIKEGDKITLELGIY